MENRRSQTTRLLKAASDGDEGALDLLFPLVYEELRGMARFQMAGERVNHTLQPTALVHEAYLRLADAPPADWGNRRYFFAAAGKAMRRILVEHARSRRRLKRGGGQVHIPLEDASIVARSHDFDWLGLDEALQVLAGIDDRLVEIVHLRFFAGMSIEETARTVGVSTRTVKRDWRYAKAFLLNHLQGNAVGENPGKPNDG